MRDSREIAPLDAVRFLDPDEIIAINRTALESGGLVGHISEQHLAKIEAATFRAPQRASYGEITVSQLAACYCHAFAKGHCFPDGNKRTAFLVAELFCDQFDLLCIASDEFIAKLMIWVALGWVGEAGLERFFDEYFIPVDQLVISENHHT